MPLFVFGFGYLEQKTRVDCEAIGTYIKREIVYNQDNDPMGMGSFQVIMIYVNISSLRSFLSANDKLNEKRSISFIIVKTIRVTITE